MKIIKKSILSLLSAALVFAAVIMPVFAVDGKTAAEWLDPYKTVTEVKGGVSMFGNATYKTAMSPDYIGFDMNIQKLNPNLDCWITIGFIKEAKEASLGDPSRDLEGLYFLMRNSGGKLNIQCFTKIGSASIFHETLEINAISKISFKLYKDGSSYYFGINNVVKPLTGITASNITNSQGKTYLAMIAYDANSDALKNRVWDILNITTKKPAGTSATTSSTAAAVQSQAPSTTTAASSTAASSEVVSSEVSSMISSDSSVSSSDTNGLAQNETNAKSGNSFIVPLIIIVCVVVIGGGIVVFFIIKKKKA